jgi:hypothetical protein
MPTFIDPNVDYHGKQLPKDRAAQKVTTPDPNVDYAGYVLPGQKATPQTQTPDQTNNPSLVIIGGVTLPGDCTISFPGKNILVQTQILDGVSVFERINRAPIEIDFDFTIRMQQIGGIAYRGTTPPSGLAAGGMPQNLFPQAYLENIWNNIFLPKSVQTLQNTLLNGLGISQLIIESVRSYTVRGSTDVPFKIRAYENVYGLPLNITQREANSYSGII